VYVFALIALAAGVLWHFVERPLAGASAVIARFGAISYGVFALITAVSWIGWPDATGRLVPDHNAGMFVAVSVQARGVLVFCLGVIALAARRSVPHSIRSILLGPLVYNVLLGSEALTAQFTPMAVPERWLYVTLHYLWAIAFGLRFVGDHAASDDHIRWSQIGKTTMMLFAIVFAVGGLSLYVLSASLLPPLPSGAPNLFLAHALHGTGAACIAVSAVAYATRLQSDPKAASLGLIVLIIAALGLATLALIRAPALAAIETQLRAVASLCLLCGAAFSLEWWRSDR
jgi:hypothetical protein